MILTFNQYILDYGPAAMWGTKRVLTVVWMRITAAVVVVLYHN